MSCHHTRYDRHDIHILWNRETKGKTIKEKTKTSTWYLVGKSKEKKKMKKKKKKWKQNQYNGSDSRQEEKKSRQASTKEASSDNCLYPSRGWIEWVGAEWAMTWIKSLSTRSQKLSYHFSSSWRGFIQLQHEDKSRRQAGEAAFLAGSDR